MGSENVDLARGTDIRPLAAVSPLRPRRSAATAFAAHYNLTRRWTVLGEPMILLAASTSI